MFWSHMRVDLKCMNFYRDIPFFIRILTKDNEPLLWGLGFFLQRSEHNVKGLDFFFKGAVNILNPWDFSSKGHLPLKLDHKLMTMVKRNRSQ